jgi:hypothetical protein
MKHLIALAALLLLASCRPAAESASPTSAPAPASTASAAPAPRSIALHARDVTIHGKTVRYEPEPHKNTIGYWSDPADWVSWDFDVPAPGTYAVHVLQGCGAGSGGAEVELTAADQTIAFTVQDTGHFQNFVDRRIGSFTFARPGRYTLSVKPRTRPGVAVMDLRLVTLKPAQN